MLRFPLLKKLTFPAQPQLLLFSISLRSRPAAGAVVLRTSSRPCGRHPGPVDVIQALWTTSFKPCGHHHPGPADIIIQAPHPVGLRLTRRFRPAASPRLGAGTEQVRRLVPITVLGKLYPSPVYSPPFSSVSVRHAPLFACTLFPCRY